VKKPSAGSSDNPSDGEGRRRIPSTEETMSIGINQAYTGQLTFDVTPVGAILFDLPPGVLQGMRRQQAGMSDVSAELAEAIPTLGAAAGVPEEAYKRFVESGDKVALVRKYRLGLDKLIEVLAESEALYEDQCEQALSQIVDAVKSTAKRSRNKGIQAPFEKSIRYTQQTAAKGVKTRKKNAAEKAARKAAAV
jgi:hypothetical protein